ncbi:hypothetical protein EBR78_08665 [bacterium]|nr:hypothetical protein [bacterium]
MKLTIIFFSWLICSWVGFASEPEEQRPLCTTMTQAQQVRFNRCRNGEVMTGIQSLDPLMVYCTTLLANCRDANTTEHELNHSLEK